MGIRDFLEHLKEQPEKAQRAEELSQSQRQERLPVAQAKVRVAGAAPRELRSVIANRRINLPEEHAVRFAQDVFLYLKDEEEKVKEKLR